MTTRILQFLAMLLSGVIFGIGLALSGMLGPVRVRGFFDVTGNWDPSLAFVMGEAVPVAMIGVALSKRLKRPALAPAFGLPENTTQIDFQCWSRFFPLRNRLGGLCHGPAVRYCRPDCRQSSPSLSQ